MTGHSVGLGTQTRLDTGLRVDPRLVLTARLLELNHLELEGRIESELSENPALERQHHTPEDPITEAQILRRLSAHELRPRGDDREMWRSLGPNDTAPDWTELAPSHTSLDEHLRAQLATALPHRLQGVAEFVVGMLNPNGYLPEPSEEVALGARCSVEEAQEVIRALQACEPAGIGASGVQECLALQLRGDASPAGRLARRIVGESLDDFAGRRVARLARRHRVPAELVEEAIARVLECNPFPAEGFARAHLPPRNLAATPDLVLRHSEAGWSIEPQGPDPSSLRVGRVYRRELAESATGDDRRHLAHYVARAGDFISSLEQRRITLGRIGGYLVEHQMDFVVTGDYEYLAPLTRSAVAKALGMHESTVSRATQGKFVQVATGEVVAFEVFFKPALRVQKMIEGIVAHEDPTDPLSDERIAELLATKGVVVARRTVNKYRDRNRQLSSRRRRVA